MKVKVNPPTSKLFGVINWKELGKALWEAVKPVLLAAIGGGIVTVAAGCSSLTPTSKTQTLSVVGIGIPAIAVVSSSSQWADASGGDENSPTQANPVTTIVPISAK